MFIFLFFFSGFKGEVDEDWKGKIIYRVLYRMFVCFRGF